MQKPKVPEVLPAEGGGLGIAERLTVSSLLEVEAAASRLRGVDGSTASSSDLRLATVEVGLGLRVNEWVTGDLRLLLEEDGTALEVEEAAVQLSRGPLSARVGRQYLPFGVFASRFITDPPTLELGETRETSFVASCAYGAATLSAFAFRGDAEKVGEGDHVGDGGAGLSLLPAQGLRLEASWLSDLAESEAELLGGTAYGRRVDGWSLFVAFGRGAVAVSGELLGATRAFDPADLDADRNGRGDKPLAWNLEAAWSPRKDLEVAARYAGAREFAGRPKRQYGVDVSWSPWKDVTLSLEYLREAPSGAFPGKEPAESCESAAKTRDAVTAQLALKL